METDKRNHRTDVPVAAHSARKQTPISRIAHLIDITSATARHRTILKTSGAFAFAVSLNFCSFTGLSSAGFFPALRFSPLFVPQSLLSSAV